MARTRTLSRIWVLCTFACLRAYADAAQFGDPYDPDFAQEEPPPAEQPAPQHPAAEPRPPEAAPEPEALPDWLREAGPFLLLDRPDPGRLFRVEAATAPRDFSEFLLRLKPFRADRESWDRMREDFEAGTMPVEGAPPGEPQEAAPRAVAEAPSPEPQPPPKEVVLPTYGTSLSITGRKLISFNFSEKRFLRDQKTSGRAKSTNLIDIEQQLQLRMQGKVGPKITVNVDYDDTKPNKQDISVVYQGDPNEVVQNASFGDIDLSLPATEFVSYNKQLFGIRVDLKYKNFKAIFIGSRTKGVTKTKQFRGNTQFVSLDIPDLSYLRRIHYDLTFANPARLPLLSGSERIFISRQIAGQANVNEVTLTADDLAVKTSTFTGQFVELQRGIDYTIDYIEGILTFRNALDPQAVLAVDFADASGLPIRFQSAVSTGVTAGNTGLFKLVKTFSDVAIVSSATETGFNRELKTFYSIGRQQVVRDDGRGNFFLRVLDSNRNFVGPSLNPPQAYPDTIEVDFEQGVFRLDKPFGISAASPSADTGLYAPQPISKGLQFALEFRFRLKTFFLEPNLVLQSEVVLLDGSKLQRNVDYFIDYDSGFLTFFNEGRMRDDSVVDVSYEVAPFAGVATESLLGTRVAYDILPKWSVGSTVLYQTGSKPQTVPSITELANSLLVYEVDSQLKDIRLFRWLSATFQGEIAQSLQNPNLSGKAVIENMEGVKQEDSAAMFSESWQFARNPSQAAFDPRAVTAFFTEDVKVKEINPTAPVTDDESQKTLTLNYDFGVSASTEISLVFPFSPTGLDFSQKNILELVLNAASSGHEINVHLGGIDEDSDGDGALDTEDLGEDGLPNTGDSGELDRVLQPDEDTGILYNPPGAAPNTATRGAANGRVDTEDLNRNGVIDAEDFSGCSIGYRFTASRGCTDQLFDTTSNSTRTALDFSGWHTFQIPLNISTATAPAFQAIKQVRVSIRKKAGTSNTGTLRFARVAVVGNSWERGQEGDPFTAQGRKAGEALTVNAVNNVDNPGYIPIFSPAAGGEANGVFEDLNGSADEARQRSNSDQLQEQALELRWSGLAAGTTVFTRRVFVRAIDISQHEKFSFLLFGNGTADKTFFLRAGTDRAFFELRVPLGFSGWRKVTARQIDRTGDQIPDDWDVGQGPPGTVAFSTGVPRLQQIGALTAGVLSTGGGSLQNAVLLNEIHVAEPIKRTGNARKLQADFAAPGWGSFGASHRFIDRNYQTPTRTVSNQDDLKERVYLNLSRLSWLPMNFSVDRSIVTTANTAAVGDRANVTTLLQEGKVTEYRGHGDGVIQIPSMPRATLSFDRFYKDTEFLDRLDDTRTLNSALNYGVPWRKFFLPNTIDLTFSRKQAKVNFLSESVRRTAGNFNTDERTHGYGVRLSFSPWQGSSLNPNYQLTTVDERRQTFFPGIGEENLKYAKSLSQQAGFTSTWRLLSWLTPSVAYSVSTIENNVLNKSTFTIGTSSTVFGIGDIKTVNRNATGNISLTFSIAQLWRRTKLFRSFSLTNSYQIQDGDVWNNIEKELDTKTALWVRTPLKPASPFAERQTLTLRDTYNSTQRWSPLEGYGITGRKSALKTLSLTNNYVQSVQRTETTATPSKTISTTLPDIIASMGQLERLLFADRWMQNMQINLKYAARKTENIGQSLDNEGSFGTDLRAIVRKRFDTSTSFNLRTTQKKDLRVDQVTQRTDHKDASVQSTFDIGKVRFTPKVDYVQDVTELGTGVQTANTRVITPSLLVRTDIALPRGLYLPLARKTLKFTNRVIWTTTTALTWRSSPVTLQENSRLFNLNTSADYEIARNLRMTLNGQVQRLWHDKLKEEDFISYVMGTTLTFQF